MEKFLGTLTTVVISTGALGMLLVALIHVYEKGVGYYYGIPYLVVKLEYTEYGPVILRILVAFLACLAWLGWCAPRGLWWLWLVVAAVAIDAWFIGPVQWRYWWLTNFALLVTVGGVAVRRVLRRHRVELDWEHDLELPGLGALPMGVVIGAFVGLGGLAGLAWYGGFAKGLRPASYLLPVDRHGEAVVAMYNGHIVLAPFVSRVDSDDSRLMGVVTGPLAVRCAEEFAKASYVVSPAMWIWSVEALERSDATRAQPWMVLNWPRHVRQWWTSQRSHRTVILDDLVLEVEAPPAPQSPVLP